MENDFEKVTACVACGSTSWTHFVEKKGYHLYRCLGCKTLSIRPLPTDERSVYDEEYFVGGTKGFGYVDYDADKEAMRSVFLSYFPLLAKFGASGGKLLDVGAATGYFLALAKEKGFSVSGIEIADFAASVGRKKGFDIQTGTLGSVALPDAFFDVVTLFDVVEHMPDPVCDLSRVYASLKSGGIAVINTPDAGSLYARVLGKRWHLLVPPEHIHCLSRAGMTALLLKSGFTVELMTTIGKRFTVEYVLHTVGKWLSLKPLLLLAKKMEHSRIGKWSFPINLRDNMFVIARKK